MNADQRKSSDAIRARARQLADEAAWRADMAHGQTFAAVADGIRSLEELDESALGACVDAYGLDAVLDAAIEGSTYRAQLSTPAVAAGASVHEFVRPVASAARTVSSPRWNRSSTWLAAAASVVLAVGALVWTRYQGAPGDVVAHHPTADPALPSPTAPPGDTPAPGPARGLVLQWPVDEVAGVQGDVVIQPQTRLARRLPDFEWSTGTLGSGLIDPIQSPKSWWASRLATVIVRVADGWGSGVVFSADGWLLSSYRVVQRTVEAASLTGSVASVRVITSRMVDGKLVPQPPLSATVYRADPSRDLVLLKLDAGVPAAHIPLASAVRAGEEGFVVGAEERREAWQMRRGDAIRMFELPLAPGRRASAAVFDRRQAAMMGTGARVTVADLGAPLVNDAEELIGLTVQAGPGSVQGVSGWHVALSEIRRFIASLPTAPEPAPFDAWSGGMSEAALIEPMLADGDSDGRVDSLRFRYTSRARSGAPRSSTGLTMFVDFSQAEHSLTDAGALLPRGVWGGPVRATFRFDVFVTVRADGVTAAGYSNPDGVVDEIRSGTSGNGAATQIWHRESGVWRPRAPGDRVPVIDVARLGPARAAQLKAILGRFVAESTTSQPH